ncbi:MAG: hypothetical protein EBQ95_02575 [Gammaproteobacteria bacterium]|nr:hypothetical protein [Gammaproteobacteria bacterium]
MPLISSKKSLFTPTKNLDVEYFFLNSEDDSSTSSVTLEGNELHKDLTMGCSQALQLRKDLRTKTGKPVYKTDLKDINFATMGMTLLYSDTDTSEGYLGDDVLSHYLPVQSPTNAQRVVSTMDFYSDSYLQAGVTDNKAKRCHLYNQSLKNRVSAFSSMSNQYHLGSAISDVTKVQEVIESSMFHETYHHTEQAGMFYIESDVYINLLLSELEKIDAALFYGFVLDIHTQRTMCANCNLSLLGMQETASAGFLNKVGHALKKRNIELNDMGISFSARVSGETIYGGAPKDAFKLPDDESIPHNLYPQIETEVFQKLIPFSIPSGAQAKKSIYKGALFASTHSTKSKWEEAIAGCKALNI